jgi:hypothetical protein
MSLTANLIGYWKLNESSGDATDSSGEGHTLTNNGTVTYSAGKLNNCANISTDKYFSNASYTDFDLGTDIFTVAFWEKRNGNPASTELMITTSSDWLTDGRYGIATRSSGRIGWSGYGYTWQTTSTSLSDNAWHRIVFVREGTGTNQFKIYVDGSLDITDTNSDNYNAGDCFIIGHVGDMWFNGFIDDVRIYKGNAWTSGDVTTDWNSGAGQELVEEKVAQSLSIDYNNGTITQAKLTSIVSSGSFNYYLTANGGTNWEAVSSGILHTFTYTGTDLRWKAITSDDGVLTQIKVEDYH